MRFVRSYCDLWSNNDDCLCSLGTTSIAIELLIFLEHIQIRYYDCIITIRMGKQKEAGGFRSFVGGGFGGVCCVISGQPFDTIKVGSGLHF